MEIKQSMVEKFVEVSGIDLTKVMSVDSKIELATFNKFSVSDELNLKMLTAQGVNSRFVKLDSKKNTTTGKKVFLFMIKNDKIVKFYDCYVVSESDKKPITLKEQGTENVSVKPTNANNNRLKTEDKKPDTIINLTSLLTNNKPVQKAIEVKTEKQPDQKVTPEVSRSEFNSLNAKIDYIMEMLTKK